MGGDNPRGFGVYDLSTFEFIKLHGITTFIKQIAKHSKIALFISITPALKLGVLLNHTNPDFSPAL